MFLQNVGLALRDLLGKVDIVLGEMPSETHNEVRFAYHHLYTYTYVRTSHKTSALLITTHIYIYICTHITQEVTHTYNWILQSCIYALSTVCRSSYKRYTCVE